MVSICYDNCVETTFAQGRPGAASARVGDCTAEKHAVFGPPSVGSTSISCVFSLSIYSSTQSTAHHPELANISVLARGEGPHHPQPPGAPSEVHAPLQSPASTSVAETAPQYHQARAAAAPAHSAEAAPQHSAAASPKALPHLSTTLARRQINLRHA